MSSRQDDRHESADGADKAGVLFNVLGKERTRSKQRPDMRHPQRSSPTASLIA